MNQSIDLSYANAAQLLLPQADDITLVLVGCGGTGSWLAPSIVRVARLLTEQGRSVRVHFVDPDTVEAKNCYRQNFCEAEIGRNKAETLAWRYGSAWGVEVTAIPQAFEAKENQIKFNGMNRLIIFVGCVDNAAARKSIQDAVVMSYRNDSRVWWLDCGNHQASGQVLIGCGARTPKDAFELTGFCSWLPMPTRQHPELLEELVEPRPDLSNLSCAEMALADSQGLAINQRIAAEASDYLVRLLITRDLRKFATYLDLASGSARSRYITPGAIQEVRHD